MTVFVRNLQRSTRIDRELLSRVATLALEWVGSRRDTIGVILVNDRQMAEFNEKFHHTTGATDILTFEYPELASGDLIISVERARAQAKRYHTTGARELALYVVHGILHLHGYDDRHPRQRRRMRAAERRVLGRLGNAFDLGKLVRL